MGEVPIPGEALGGLQQPPLKPSGPVLAAGGAGGPADCLEDQGWRYGTPTRPEKWRCQLIFVLFSPSFKRNLPRLLTPGRDVAPPIPKRGSPLTLP